MMVTLHSAAAPDVAMLRDLAQYLLGILGKRIGDRGIITADELPEAIHKLEAAISIDETLRGTREDGSLANLAGTKSLATSLAQRAYPLLDMMRVARLEHADILWGL